MTDYTPGTSIRILTLADEAEQDVENRIVALPPPQRRAVRMILARRLVTAERQA